MVSFIGVSSSVNDVNGLSNGFFCNVNGPRKGRHSVCKCLYLLMIRKESSKAQMSKWDYRVVMKG